MVVSTTGATVVTCGTVVTDEVTTAGAAGISSGLITVVVVLVSSIIESSPRDGIVVASRIRVDVFVVVDVLVCGSC